MKTPVLARVAALLAAATTTFALVQSLALYALPTQDMSSQFAQVATPIAPR